MRGVRLLLAVALLLPPALLPSAAVSGEDQQSSSQPPSVFLNHVFFVPDEETYKAIQEAAWLFEEFAPGEVRTTVRSDMSYSGIYFYGRNTYFEFLQPGTAFPAGASAVAFGVERPEELAQLAAHLKTKGIETMQFPQTRADGAGNQVPWFQMIMGPMEPGRLGVWTMAYEPEFLPSWYPEAGGPTQGTSRADILGRYAAKVVPERKAESFLLGDVSELDLHLPELVRFEWDCTDLGFRAAVMSSGAVCNGPDFRIHAVQNHEKGPMLRAITLRLNRPKQGQQEYRLGRTVLRFEGNEARWEFAPSGNTGHPPR